MGASPLQECLALDDFPTFVHVHHLGMHHMSRAKCVVGQMGLATRTIWSAKLAFSATDIHLVAPGVFTLLDQ